MDRSFSHKMIVIFLVILLYTRVVSTESSSSSSSSNNMMMMMIRCKDVEREALLKFKQDLNADTLLSSWGSEEHKRECCDWIGIRCHNKSGHVISLDISPSTFSFEDITEYRMTKSHDPGTLSQYKNTLGLVKFIDLSSNKLIGNIPREIFELDGLVSLNLSRNNLSGQIPTEIGQLVSLDALDLSRNHFFGKIPSSLSKVDRLSTLDLSWNNLSGKIPTSPQLQARDETSYIGNPKLCGSPLLKKCQPAPPLHLGDEHKENEDELITKGFFISLGVGFVVGFWGICFTLIFNKSLRYASLKFLNDVEDWMYVTTRLIRRKYFN
ncbi:receptor-like protein EIX2 isoform X2 [Cannabis sativa]|uniref:receptor-like protein EIX2 isoform X2 n=1 Tax=Cannabis sativa TaxID=3483 RepID=UPI0029C9FDB6|nr:receptor-like protein EIX2 isoform X2 [Cannabis sativa]